MKLFSDILEYLYAPGGGVWGSDSNSPTYKGKRQPAAVNVVLRFLKAQNVVPLESEIGRLDFPNLKKALRKHRSSLKFVSENTNVQGPRKKPGGQEGGGIFVNFDKWNHYLDS